MIKKIVVNFWNIVGITIIEFKCFFLIISIIISVFIYLKFILISIVMIINIEIITLDIIIVNVKVVFKHIKELKLK